MVRMTGHDLVALDMPTKPSAQARKTRGKDSRKAYAPQNAQ